MPSTGRRLLGHRRSDWVLPADLEGVLGGWVAALRVVVAERWGPRVGA